MGEVVAVALHRLCHPMQQSGAVEGAEPRHRGPRPVRRLDGTRGIGPGPFR